ncbi:MAG: hypothetical protein ABIR03_11995 [Ginsengibacter sp.]
MEQLILKVKDKSKMPFLRKLLKHLDFLEVVEAPEKELTSKEKRILDDIEESVQQVKLHLDGKIKLKPIQELLDEL